MTASESRLRGGRRLGAGVLAVALGVAGAVTVSSPASAAEFEVTTLADAGPGSLRQAVIDANNEMLFPGADEITFTAGLSGTIPLASTLDITEEVTIDGTGADITISRDNAAGDFDLVHVVLPANTPFTLIDIAIVGDEADPLQLGRGLVVEGFAADTDIGRVQLTDVTIANHKAAPGDSGGGAYVRDSVYLDVLRGAISSNEADANQPGGGLHLDGGNMGSLHMTGTQVVSNTGGIGGGIAVDEVNGVFIIDALFQLNTANSQDLGTGGAIDATEIAIDGVEISDSRFYENLAELHGGAVSIVDSGRPDIARSTFFSNVAEDGQGGALFIDDIFQGSTVADSTFTDNQAEGDGGAIAFETIDLGDSHSVTGSTFSDNDSDDLAASIALRQVAGSFLLQNSTLDELTEAGDPAAFVAVTIEPTAVIAIANATVTGPGGVFFITHAGTATIENSILDGLDGPPVGIIDGAGTVTVSHSLLTAAPLGSVTLGAGNVTTPTTGLLALANNGGPTQTRLLDPGSAAVDAGDPAFAAPPATDQRGAGFPRVQNGRLDMGAVEIIPTLPATGATISWWLLIVASAVLALGAVALVLARRARRGGAAH